MRTFVFHIISVFFYGIEALIIVGMGALAYEHAKHHYRRLQEYFDNRKNRRIIEAVFADENEDDFEESYVPRPGKRLITSCESDRMWRELDKLNDEAILKNTKDL